MNSMCWIPWWSATIFWPSSSIESMMKLKGSFITNSFHMNRRCRKPKFAIWNGCVQNCVAPPWHFRAEMSPSACKFCLLRTLKKRFPNIKCVFSHSVCVCVISPFWRWSMSCFICMDSMDPGVARSSWEDPVCRTTLLQKRPVFLQPPNRKGGYPLVN